MNELDYALRESAMNAAADEYFAARPGLDSRHARKLFEAGFERAWNTAPRKPLTNEDIWRVANSMPDSKGNRPYIGPMLLAKQSLVVGLQVHYLHVQVVTQWDLDRGWTHWAPINPPETQK